MAMETESEAHGEDEVQNSFTEDSAFDFDLACRESRAWIEAVLQEQFGTPDTSEGFQEGIRNGQRLCRFINCIQPKAVKKINRMTAAFACMENITWFVEACRKLGLRDTQLFCATDLYAGSETGSVGVKARKREAAIQKDKDRKLRDVCITIYWLGRAVRGMKNYDGPHLNLAAFVKLNCTRCSQAIRDEDYIVDKGCNFHPLCFYCDTCDKNPIDPSEDFKWCFQNHILTCGDCRCIKCKVCLPKGQFRQMNDKEKICPTCDCANQCATCKDLLTEDQVYEHDGKRYCPKCVCAHKECHLPINPKRCTTIDGLKYCGNCVCTSCQGLVGDQFAEANGKKYCSKCCCADEACRSALVNDKFTVIDGKKYCPDCLCAGCKGFAGSQFLLSNGKKYCPACCCADEACKNPLVKGKSTEIDGKKYCADCVCAGCKGLAGNQFVELDGKKYCPECCCADETCNNPLVQGKYSEIDGKKYCPDCMCHASHCNNYATDHPIICHNKKYCPMCVCADEDCRKPLEDEKAEAEGKPTYTEIDGERYCNKCTCQREGCGKLPGTDAIVFDGKKYCPDCVCADKHCGKPLKTGEYSTIPATGLFKGGHLCHACVCTICKGYLGKAPYLRRKGERFCKQCCCGGCKVALKDHIPKVTPTNNNPEERQFCKRCVCYGCERGLARKDKRTLYEGHAYCNDCLCALCEKVISGPRAEKVVPYEGKKVCGQCTCSVCATPLPKKERMTYGGKIYCKTCVCSTCNKPATELRGQLKLIGDKAYCEGCLCYTCKEPLGSSKIEFGDHTYCLNCVCASCQTSVPLEGRTVKDKKTYCPKCVCVQCDAVLEDGKKRRFGEMSVCSKCACARCGRPESVKGTDVIEEPFIKTRGKKYCVHCVCGSCNKALEDDEYDYCKDCTCEVCGTLLDDDEDKYCESCGVDKPGFKPRDLWRKEKKEKKKEKEADKTASTSSPTSAAETAAPPIPAKRGSTANQSTAPHPEDDNSVPVMRRKSSENTCARCEKDLKGSIVAALDKKYHSDCFTCTMCNTALKSGFMAHEDLPYCDDCIGKASGVPDCSGCNKSVSGAYLTLGDGQSWHKNCFKCATCDTPLANSSYRMEKGMPTCPKCYKNEK